MGSRKKAGLSIFLILVIGVFGYSQYMSAMQIETNIISSTLTDEINSNYDIELEFKNPSLLLLAAGKTDFNIVADGAVIGNGKLDPFTLQPLDTSYVKGTYHTYTDDKDAQSLVITGITKYDIGITTIDVPFAYYPTQEQAREFIYQN